MSSRPTVIISLGLLLCLSGSLSTASVEAETINPSYLPLLPYCRDITTGCGRDLRKVLVGYSQICALEEKGDCLRWYDREELLKDLIVMVGPQQAAELSPLVER